MEPMEVALRQEMPLRPGFLSSHPGCQHSASQSTPHPSCPTPLLQRHPLPSPHLRPHHLLPPSGHGAHSPWGAQKQKTYFSNSNNFMAAPSLSLPAPNRGGHWGTGQPPPAVMVIPASHTIPLSAPQVLHLYLHPWGSVTAGLGPADSYFTCGHWGSSQLQGTWAGRTGSAAHAGAAGELTQARPLSAPRRARPWSSPKEQPSHIRTLRTRAPRSYQQETRALDDHNEVSGFSFLISKAPRL